MQNLTRVSAKELASAVTTKKDIYDALTIKGRCYLMPYRNCTMNFLKQILQRKKKVLSMEEANFVTLPGFREFNARCLVTAVKKNKFMMEFLPDEDELNPHNCSKEYLSTIINTLDPTYFPKCIKICEERRQGRGVPTKEKDLITIDANLLEILRQHVTQ